MLAYLRLSSRHSLLGHSWRANHLLAYLRLSSRHSLLGYSWRANHLPAYLRLSSRHSLLGCSWRTNHLLAYFAFPSKKKDKFLNDRFGIKSPQPLSKRKRVGGRRFSLLVRSDKLIVISFATRNNPCPVVFLIGLYGNGESRVETAAIGKRTPYDGQVPTFIVEPVEALAP